MSWAQPKHPIEKMAEWLAPLPLALALNWAGVRLGLPVGAAVPLALAALAAGIWVMRAAGGHSPAGFEFSPSPVEADSGAPGELLLEEKDKVLLLDDPLVEVGEDSRVVRLFAPPALTPGELVERIEGFLDDHRRDPRDSTPQPGGPHVDASSALQEALANIRASLR